MQPFACKRSCVLQLLHIVTDAAGAHKEKTPFIIKADISCYDLLFIKKQSI